MSNSEESDDGKFSGGEEEETSRKRKKPQARKNKKIKKDNTNKGDKKTGGMLLLQTYRSSERPWCGTTAINNIMQIPLISTTMMTTSNGSFAGNLGEDIDMRLNATPELDFIMSFLVTNGYSGAPAEPGMIIQLAASEQYYLVNRGGKIELIKEGPALTALLARDLRIHVELADYEYDPPQQWIHRHNINDQTFFTVDILNGNHEKSF